MLTAEKARENAENNISGFDKDDFNNAMQTIEDAVNHGHFEIARNGTLRENTKRLLENLGYKIESGSQYNEFYYKIKW